VAALVEGIHRLWSIWAWTAAAGPRPPTLAPPFGC